MRIMVTVDAASERETKPCEAASWEDFVRIDTRSRDDPSKVAYHLHQGKSDWWYSEGRNHRVEGGCIRRDFDDEAWFVRFNSLEELASFMKTEGGVLTVYYGNEDILRLELEPDWY